MPCCCCHGCAGVKVDVQNQLEMVGTAAGQQGGQVLAEAWHTALEDSIAAHFPGNALINCMCHNTSVSTNPNMVSWGLG
jgi:raffinose synthase